MYEFTSPPAPVQAGTASAAAAGTSTRTAALARVGLLGIGAAALIAAAALAFGYGATPTGTLAAGTGTEAPGGAMNLNGFGGGPGDRGGRGPGPGLGGITITAISGSNLSLKTADGWTRTITVDADTTYSEGGDAIALGDLAVGDQIAFRQTLEDDGSWTIDKVAVILPHVGGEVTAISGSTITIEQRDGTSATITVNGATEYRVNGDTAALADVEVGMFLVARGTENADGSLTATDVRAGERGKGGRGGFHGRWGPDGNWGEKPDAEASSAPGSAN